MRFFAGGGRGDRSTLGSTLLPAPSMDGTTTSPGPAESGFFRLVYFRFSCLAGSSDSPSFLLPLGLLVGGGVTPPFASRFAASFCSLAISARSRFDMMPSFGGRPGPRRLTGGTAIGFPLASSTGFPGSGAAEADGFLDSVVLLSALDSRGFSAFLADSLVFFGFCGLTTSSVVWTGTSWGFSGGGEGSSSLSAPVSPIGTSGNKNLTLTPPIWM